ncbi:MAG TPA: hypothetical protein VFR34_13045, partial [Paracoccaceae bacterium]|nr:hypothetical protein [Paracoccaceae bacterium]
MPSKTEIKLELETRRKSVAEAIIAAQRRGDQAAVDSLMPAHREVQLALDKLALASAEAMLPLLAALNERIAAALAKAKMGAIEGAFARQPRPVPAGGGDGASEAEVEPTVAPGPAPVTEPAVSPEPVTEAESEEELPPETEPATGGAPAPALAHVSAPDPATAPAVPGAFTLTEAHLIALWRRSSFPIDGRGIIVFGIRGMLPVEFAGTPLGAAHPVTFGAPNYRTMCCTLGHWRPGLGLTLFPGSTVPFGSSVEQARARNGVGTNQMGPGRYRNYVAGWHKRSEGPSGHWALVQDCAITLQRSGDDADYDADDRWEVGRIAGDNIHCAHNMGPDSNIAGASFSSLGCQVVAGKVDKGRPGSERGPWAKFIAP